MSKTYYITNGLDYVQKIDGKYKTTRCSSMADVYNYATATKVARNSLPRHMKKTFYLKEVETSEIIDIHKYKSEASGIVENKQISFDESIIQDIKREAEDIMSLSTYSYTELIKKREVLNAALSFYDMNISDIRHAVRKKNPPAHIRTIIYGMLQKVENMHEEIKQVINYTDVMITANMEDWNLSKLQTELKNAKFVPYKGRTYIYDEIMQMIG